MANYEPKTPLSSLDIPIQIEYACFWRTVVERLGFVFGQALPHRKGRYFGVCTQQGHEVQKVNS